MKKIVAVLLGILLISVSLVAFADAPASDKFESLVFYSLEDVADGPCVVNGENDIGWVFYSNDVGALKFSSEGNTLKLVEHNNGLLTMRLDIPNENMVDAENAAKYDMIGFYFENNTAEPCGIGMFGENTTDGYQHQMTYVETPFEDIECYFVDLDGKVYQATEYLDDYGHGLAEVPAGFKGYFMVTLNTMGSDNCNYAGFGWHECDGGKWKSGQSSVFAAGLSLHAVNCDEGESFVFDDWFLAKKGDSFEAEANLPGIVVATPTPDQPTQTPAPTPTATPNGAVNPAQSQQATPTSAPTATSAPQGGVAVDSSLIIIIIAAVLMVAAVVIIVISNNKKK